MARLMLALAAVTLGLASEGIAETAVSYTATVYARVDPSIGCNVTAPTVNVGSVLQGNFSATIRFSIEANQAQVGLYVEATALYKGSDPQSNEVMPIPLNLGEGVRIEPASATPVGGGSNVAQYIGDTLVEDFPAKKTATITFESSQGHRFGQDVFVTVTWTQPDTPKPTGEYGGRVKLTALLLP